MMIRNKTKSFISLALLGLISLISTGCYYPERDHYYRRSYYDGDRDRYSRYDYDRRYDWRYRRDRDRYDDDRYYDWRYHRDHDRYSWRDRDRDWYKDYD